MSKVLTRGSGFMSNSALDTNLKISSRLSWRFVLEYCDDIKSHFEVYTVGWGVTCCCNWFTIFQYSNGKRCLQVTDCVCFNITL